MISSWHPTPESSNVAAIGFDEDTKEILVQFKNGTFYAYDPATTIFESFVLSSSKGKFVNEVFKQGGVAVRKIDQTRTTKLAELEAEIQEAGGTKVE